MKALVLNDDGKFGTAEFPAGNGTPSGLLPPIRWFQWVFDIGALYCKDCGNRILDASYDDNVQIKRENSE